MVAEGRILLSSLRGNWKCKRMNGKGDQDLRSVRHLFDMNHIEALFVTASPRN
jgi:hypothetical protein